MKVKDIIDKGLSEFINNPEYSHLPKHFLFSNYLEQNALLFIGINPSSEEGQSEYASFELEQRNNKHPYFKKFEEISDYCNLPWTHIDLLFFRETNQNTIYEILKQKNGVTYIWKQLKIADELINMSSPQAIIVCNTLARTFMGKDKIGENNAWLNYSFVFNEEIGTYLMGETPVFFSGMLSGQRALDLGSYERLKWQIKKALMILNQNKINEIENFKTEHIKNGRIEEAARLEDTKKYFLIKHEILCQKRNEKK